MEPVQPSLRGNEKMKIEIVKIGQTEYQITFKQKRIEKQIKTRFVDLAGLREKYLGAEIYIEGRLRFAPPSLTPIE